MNPRYLAPDVEVWTRYWNLFRLIDDEAYFRLTRAVWSEVTRGLDMEPSLARTLLFRSSTFESDRDSNPLGVRSRERLSYRATPIWRPRWPRPRQRSDA